MLEYALIPWFFLALNRLLRSPTARSGATLAATIGIMALSGQPQIQYYALLFGFLWSAGCLLSPSRSAKDRLSPSCSAKAGARELSPFRSAKDRAGILSPFRSAKVSASVRSRVRLICWGWAALCCGFLLGAVQLLPSLELAADGFAQSPRGTNDYASHQAMNAADLARMLVPNALGNPLCALTPFDDGNYFHERMGYVGVLPLLLAMYGLLRRNCARWQWGAAILVLFGLTLALANNTPLFKVLAAAVPGFTLFRCPGRIFAVLTPFIGILAGGGLDAWANREPHGGKPAAWRVALAAAFLILLAGFGTAALPDNYAWDDYALYVRQHLRWELATSAVTVAVALVVLLALPSGLAPRLCCLAALFATLLDLGDQTVGNFSLEPRQTVSARSVGNGLRAVPPVGNGLRAVPPVENGLRAVPPNRVGRSLGAPRNGTQSVSYRNDAPIRIVDAPDLRPNSGTLTYSKIVPMLVGMHVSSVVTDEGGVLPSSLSRLHRAIEKAPSVALAASGCNYTCAHGGELGEPLRGALPRLRLLPLAQRDLIFTPIEELQPAHVASLRRTLMQSVEIVLEDPQTLEVRVTSPEGGMLVVADLFYPGWECTVDGQTAAIEAAHGVFRAVELKKGEHRVVFRYHPASFRIGAYCSLAGLLLVAILIALPIARKTEDRRPKN